MTTIRVKAVPISSSAGAPPPVRPGNVTSWLGGLAVGVLLVFAVYASLQPFNFTGNPLEFDREVIERRFAQGTQIRGRIDLCVNAAFFWLVGMAAGAWLGLRPEQPLRSFGKAVVILASSLTLSVCNELAQVWLPERVPSMLDIFAQGIGAFAGIGTWCVVGNVVRDSTEHAARSTSGMARVDFALHVYFVVLLFMSLYPFDVIVGAEELGLKYRRGQIELHPLVGIGPDKALVMDMVILAFMHGPVGLLATRIGLGGAGTRDLPGSVAVAVGMAGLVEFLQLFVNSRFTMTGHWIVASSGALIGVLVAQIWRRIEQRGKTGPGRIASGELLRSLWLAGAAVSLAVPAVTMLWPLEFSRDTTFIRMQMERMWASGFDSIQETNQRNTARYLERAVLMLPLGTMLGMFVLSGLRRRHGLATVGCAALLAMISLAIEFLQVFTPTRTPDLADAVSLAAGGVCGVFLAYWIGLFRRKAF